MLGVMSFFDEALFAPIGDDPQFSKRAVIQEVLREHGLRGEELLGFGDGVVETEEVRRVGGVAVAVASAEPPRRGVNAAKRRRLIQAGADVVIADYDCRRPIARVATCGGMSDALSRNSIARASASSRWRSGSTT